VIGEQLPNVKMMGILCKEGNFIKIGRALRKKKEEEKEPKRHTKYGS
jgi:hypothetical protein